MRRLFLTTRYIQISIKLRFRRDLSKKAPPSLFQRSNRSQGGRPFIIPLSGNESRAEDAWILEEKDYIRGYNRRRFSRIGARQAEKARIDVVPSTALIRHEFYTICRSQAAWAAGVREYT